MLNSEKIQISKRLPELYISESHPSSGVDNVHAKLVQLFTTDYQEEQQILYTKRVAEDNKINETKCERKKKILIVDSSLSLRTTLIRELSDEYELIGYGDAEEALDNCVRIEPDIILLDILLEGSIDGLSFIKIIKEDKKILNVPIILMSFLSTDEIVLEGLSHGANDYLVKPVDFRHLDLKIKNFIKLKNNVKDKILIEQNKKFEIRNEEEERLLKFDLLIEKGIMNDIEFKIEKCAQELNMSLRSLERMIKKNHHMSPAQYIIQRKLKKADILIRSQKGISVKEISLLLGFNSLAYFCKCYKNFFAKSPLEVC